jgi:hypothetical protein
VVLPARLAKSAHVDLGVLLGNTRQLVGGYDVHKTLLELVRGEPVTPAPFDSEKYRRWPSPRSLVREPVPANRCD